MVTVKAGNLTFVRFLSLICAVPKPSKRKPIAKRDAAIGKRLQAARERLRLSQREVAEQIGITRERLASYEDGRVALRFEIALKFCRQFIISEKWLASGDAKPNPDLADIKPYVGFIDFRHSMDLANEPVVNQIKLGTLFSEAFDSHLSSVYQELATKHVQPRLRIHPTEIALTNNALLMHIERWNSRLTAAQLHRFLRHLLWSSEEAVMRISEGYILESEREFLIEVAEQNGEITPAIRADEKKLDAFLKPRIAAYLKSFQELA